MKNLLSQAVANKKAVTPKEAKPSTFNAIKGTSNRQKEEQRTLSGALKWLMNDKQFLAEIKHDELLLIRLTSNSLIDLINICKANFTDKEKERKFFTSYTTAQILRRDIKN